MQSRLALLFRYLQYYWKASSRHDIHSPFVFQFMEEVLRDKRQFYDFGKIESIRKELLHQKQTIQITDFGAGSIIKNGSQKQIAAIAHDAAKSAKYGQLLFRIVNYFQPKYMLELGTSLGISAAYLASAKKEAELITLEGCEPIAVIAQRNFEQLQLNHIQQVTGNFDDTLPVALEKLLQIDLAFVDGNHREEPTLRYLEKILTKTKDDSVLIFDDIHWNKEMEAAWQQIKDHTSVRLSIDLFFMGMVFFKKEFREKQHFVLRY